MPQPPAEMLETLRAQIAQGLLEHEIVVQALLMQAVVSGLAILFLGWLAIALWKRQRDLHAAFVAEIRRHSFERIALVKQHSLEQSSLQMQMLQAFESIASRRRAPSAASSSSPTPAASTTRPPDASARVPSPPSPSAPLAASRRLPPPVPPRPRPPPMPPPTPLGKRPR